MQSTPGFGQLATLVDEIKKKESDRVKLESQVRQLRLRAESEAADASELKSELEAAQAERMSLQKRIGLLSRKNEDLAAENGKLTEEKCDFQRSMANNEAKLKENEEDLRRAQREFVQELEGANRAYSHNRAVMNTLLGRKGAGCAEVPSGDEIENLRNAAAKTQEAVLRAAELEARLKGIEAESQAFKNEAAEANKHQEALRAEIASWEEQAKRTTISNNSGGGQESGPKGGAASSGGRQIDDGSQQHITYLQEEVSKLEDTCSRQADYINQLEDYANSVEAANAQLMQQQQSGGDEGEGQRYAASGDEPVPMSTDMEKHQSIPSQNEHRSTEDTTMDWQHRPGDDARDA